jgi:hypothetical protein
MKLARLNGGMFCELAVFEHARLKFSPSHWLSRCGESRCTSLLTIFEARSRLRSTGEGQQGEKNQVVEDKSE